MKFKLAPFFWLGGYQNIPLTFWNVFISQMERRKLIGWLENQGRVKKSTRIKSLQAKDNQKEQ